LRIEVQVRRVWATKGRGGRQPYLAEAQIGQLTAALDEGPGARGHIEDQRWTPARIRDLIQGMFGVRYKDLSTVSRRLPKAGYSWQVPVLVEYSAIGVTCSFTAAMLDSRARVPDLGCR